MRALATHEQGHVDLILATVATMPGRLAGDCAGVDNRGHLVLAEIDAAGAEYDAATLSVGPAAAFATPCNATTTAAR